MYLVLEIQTNTDGTVSTIITPYNDRANAESKYHTILAAAAISQVPCHSAVMMTNTGAVLAAQYYEHVSGMTGGGTGE